MNTNDNNAIEDTIAKIKRRRDENPERYQQLEQLLEAAELDDDDQMITDEEIDDLLEILTETGLAEMFVERSGDQHKYIRELGDWVYWENEKWNIDKDGHVIRSFKQIPTYLKEQRDRIRVRAKACTDEEEQKRLFKKAGSVDGTLKKVRNKNGIVNTIALAESEHGVTIPYSQFDTKGHFIGVANGVLDLRNSQLVSGDPSYLMMRTSPVEFDSDAECPNWLQFLSDVMEGDQDKVNLLQHIAGSMFVGNTKEKMFIFQGGGANGKSTFVNVIGQVLGATDAGGYKAIVKPEVFTDKVNNPEYFLANLKGARAIFMSETAYDGLLQDTLVKQVVDSEEGLQARVVRGEAFSFPVIGTIAMLTNNLPKVISTDNGTWRRLCLVEFNRVFTENEKDRTLVSKKLVPELSGILNWCVEGARQYIKNGHKFEIPEVVEASTLEWRNGEDKIGSFISERMVNDGSFIKLTEFYDEFKDWCEMNGQHPGSVKELRKRLTARGMEVVNAGSGATARVNGWSLMPSSGITEVKNHIARNRGDNQESQLIDYE